MQTGPLWAMKIKKETFLPPHREGVGKSLFLIICNMKFQQSAFCLFCLQKLDVEV